MFWRWTAISRNGIEVWITDAQWFLSNLNVTFTQHLITKGITRALFCCLKMCCNSWNCWAEEAPKITRHFPCRCSRFHLCGNDCEPGPLGVKKSLQQPVKPAGSLIWSYDHGCWLHVCALQVCVCTCQCSVKSNSYSQPCCFPSKNTIIQICCTDNVTFKGKCWEASHHVKSLSQALGVCVCVCGLDLNIAWIQHRFQTSGDAQMPAVLWIYNPTRIHSLGWVVHDVQ